MVLLRQLCYNGAMAQYITTLSGIYYTTSGQQGGNYPAGLIFEGGATKVIRDIERRNKLDTNLWIPVTACRLYEVEPEPPVDPPTDPIDLSQFDRIVMKRIGHLVNGVIEYGQFSYTGEKDLDV